MDSLKGIWQAQVATGNPSPPVAVSGDSAGTTPAAGKPAPPASPAAPQAEAREAPPVDQVSAAAKHIEKYLSHANRSLEFSVDEATGRTVVSVRDAETGKLIRQIPGEEVLRLASILGPHSGTLIDLNV